MNIRVNKLHSRSEINPHEQWKRSSTLLLRRYSIEIRLHELSMTVLPSGCLIFLQWSKGSNSGKVKGQCKVENGRSKGKYALEFRNGNNLCLQQTFKFSHTQDQDYHKNQRIVQRVNTLKIILSKDGIDKMGGIIKFNPTQAFNPSNFSSGHGNFQCRVMDCPDPNAKLKFTLLYKQIQNHPHNKSTIDRQQQRFQSPRSMISRSPSNDSVKMQQFQTKFSPTATLSYHSKMIKPSQQFQNTRIMTFSPEYFTNSSPEFRNKQHFQSLINQPFISKQPPIKQNKSSLRQSPLTYIAKQNLHDTFQQNAYFFQQLKQNQQLKSELLRAIKQLDRQKAINNQIHIRNCNDINSLNRENQILKIKLHEKQQQIANLKHQNGSRNKEIKSLNQQRKMNDMLHEREQVAQQYKHKLAKLLKQYESLKQKYIQQEGHFLEYQNQQKLLHSKDSKQFADLKAKLFQNEHENISLKRQLEEMEHMIKIQRKQKGSEIQAIIKQNSKQYEIHISILSSKLINLQKQARNQKQFAERAYRIAQEKRKQLQQLVLQLKDALAQKMQILQGYDYRLDKLTKEKDKDYELLRNKFDGLRRKLDSYQGFGGECNTTQKKKKDFIYKTPKKLISFTEQKQDNDQERLKGLDQKQFTQKAIGTSSNQIFTSNNQINQTQQQRQLRPQILVTYLIAPIQVKKVDTPISYQYSQPSSRGHFEIGSLSQKSQG